MAKRRIHAKGGYQYDERIAYAAISPGMLVEQVPNAATVRAHATEGGDAEAMFALEDALQGNTVSTDYDAADLVCLILPEKGCCVNALLLAGYDYQIGTELISAGDGTLKPKDNASSGTTVDRIIAVNTEDQDLSDSGAEDTLTEVRIV